MLGGLLLSKRCCHSSSIAVLAKPDDLAVPEGEGVDAVILVRAAGALRADPFETQDADRVTFGEKGVWLEGIKLCLRLDRREVLTGAIVSAEVASPWNFPWTCNLKLGIRILNTQNRIDVTPPEGSVRLFS